MYWNWINWTKVMGVLLCAGMVILSGCATNAEDMMTHGDATMLDIWQDNTAGSGGSVNTSQARLLLDARQSLRRPLIDADIQNAFMDQASYTRTAHNEVTRQFQRLPNPDLVMYVFPHLAGSDPVPVPGYSTVFPLYQRVQYAMPGERTEPY